MVDFSKLKDSRGGAAALQKQLEKSASKGFGNKNDPRFWRPTKGSKGVSENIIRFLPIPKKDYLNAEQGLLNEAELTPVSKRMKNSFKGPTGQFYNEFSLRTFGEKDPVSEYAFAQWALVKELGDDPAGKAAKDRVKQFFSKDEYIAGILVISDGTNPENNGKVFLYEYGNAIAKKIDEAGNPKFSSQKPVDPFDFFSGANLIMNLSYEKKQIGQWKGDVANYAEGVVWEAPSALFGGDETKINEVWEAQHSIMEFLDPKLFKSYDELKAKFIKVMNLDEDFNPVGDGSSLGKSVQKAVTQSLPTTPEPTLPTKQAVDAAGTKDTGLDEFQALLNS